jgi:hypothetical protein
MEKGGQAHDHKAIAGGIELMENTLKALAVLLNDVLSKIQENIDEQRKVTVSCYICGRPFKMDHEKLEKLPLGCVMVCGWHGYGENKNEEKQIET